MRTLLWAAMLVLATPAVAQNNTTKPTTPPAKVTPSRIEQRDFKRWCVRYPVSCQQKMAMTAKKPS